MRHHPASPTYREERFGQVRFKNLFSSPKVQAPVVPAPVIVPTENSAAITQAQQQELAAGAFRTGRASTILSQNDISKTDSMGG